MSPLNRLLVAVVITGAVHVGAAPARADFCLEANNAPDGHFFRFKKSYPGTLKPGKLLALNGKVLALDNGSVVGTGPAYGQLLGLPEDQAGFQLGISFAYGTTVAGSATITLDDNGGTSGGGTIYLEPATTVGVIAQIVDCATEPVP